METADRESPTGGVGGLGQRCMEGCGIQKETPRKRNRSRVTERETKESQRQMEWVKTEREAEWERQSEGER